MTKKQITINDKNYDLFELSKKFDKIYKNLDSVIYEGKGDILSEVLEAEEYSNKFTKDHIGYFHYLSLTPGYVEKIFKNNTNIHKYGYFVTDYNKLKYAEPDYYFFEQVFDRDNISRDAMYGLMSKYYGIIKEMNPQRRGHFRTSMALEKDIYKYSSYFYKYNIIKEFEGNDGSSSMPSDLKKLYDNKNFMRYYDALVNEYNTIGYYMHSLYNLSSEDIGNDADKYIRFLEILQNDEIRKADYTDLAKCFKKLEVNDAYIQGLRVTV